MKKMIIVFACLFTGLLIVIITIQIDIHKKINRYVSRNDLLLKNIEALSQESNNPTSPGSNFKIICNTPTDDSGGKCSVVVITCQGNGHGCTPHLCPQHN
jgi:hypothetical protein